MLKKSEIYRLVNDYIGVSKGYLNGFSYSKHYEFYINYCDLDNINVADYEPGTTVDKFIRILEDADSPTQAKILKGVFKKFPLSSFGGKDHERKRELYDEYQAIISKLESSIHSINGEFKNLIFAANGPKPEIVLLDATTNHIKIVKNEEYCLIYDRPLQEKGLLWEELVDWWSDRENLADKDRSEQRRSLFQRLRASIEENNPETTLFHEYYKFVFDKLKDKLDKIPALIPQVYLHYDPYTRQYLNRSLARQRMDFLLLLPYGKSIVIEIDGKQHYSENGQANPRLYAEMVAEDRRLKLTGYEIYRFGGYEFIEAKKAEQIVVDFFSNLFKQYSII